MPNIASIPRRIFHIKRLAREYYELPDKAPIERHAERLRLFDIRGSKHGKKHPHQMKRVYMTRMALKHFVESRKAELMRRHTTEEALKKIDFALEQMQEVLTNFDSYEYQPNGEKYFFTKDYQSIGQPPIRILLVAVNKHLEICSFHFRKPDKTK
ncbi:MAG: hypothetical protein AAB964_00080 [Patescibacteria group bacterium]